MSQAVFPVAKLQRLSHKSVMSSVRYMMRFFLICVIVISQGLFAHTHASFAGPGEARHLAVICTPTGPQEIAWSFGEAEVPSEAQATACPLCIIGMAVAPLPPCLAFARIPLPTISYPNPTSWHSVQAAGAPYPARAPPV